MFLKICRENEKEIRERLNLRRKIKTYEGELKMKKNFRAKYVEPNNYFTKEALKVFTDKKDNKEDLNRMGSGWFVIKFAEDNNIKTNTTSTYGKESAMKRRVYTYEKTKNCHLDIVKYLLDNWNSKISAGSPKLTNQELRKLLEDLAKKLGLN